MTSLFLQIIVPLFLFTALCGVVAGIFWFGAWLGRALAQPAGTIPALSLARESTISQLAAPIDATALSLASNTDPLQVLPPTVLESILTLPAAPQTSLRLRLSRLNVRTRFAEWRLDMARQIVAAVSLKSKLMASAWSVHTRMISANAP